MPTRTNQIERSTDYDKFEFIASNRVTDRGHIESLRSSFEEIGNLTQSQPILVNEFYQIIDGQHRFTVAKEMGLPIFYVKHPGLRIHDARKMNMLQRNWNFDDWAHSYAETGDENYKKFLELRADYGFNHSITLMYALGDQGKGGFQDFRDGNFVLTDEVAARERLDKYTEVLQSFKGGKDKNFAYAFLKVIKTPDYDQARMVRKIRDYGDYVIRHYGSVPEFLRALEEVYNYRMGENNRLALY